MAGVARPIAKQEQSQSNRYRAKQEQQLLRPARAHEERGRGWVRVACWAGLSRAFTLALFFTGDALFLDYDTSALLSPPCRAIRAGEDKANAPREFSGGDGGRKPCTKLPGTEAACNSATLSSAEPSLPDQQGGVRPPGSQSSPVGFAASGERQVGPTGVLERTAVGRISALAEALRSKAVWDGVFFVRIAQCGYEVEQMHAFQPGLPALLRRLAPSPSRSSASSQGPNSTASHRVLPRLHHDDDADTQAWLALAGLGVSNVGFVVAAVLLYQVSCLALPQCPGTALLAALLFCISPASTFFSSIYAESLFAMLSFGGMYLWLQAAQPLLNSTSAARWQHWALSPIALIGAALAFAASSAVRSNGVLHAGFFLYSLLLLASCALRQSSSADWSKGTLRQPLRADEPQGPLRQPTGEQSPQGGEQQVHNITARKGHQIMRPGGQRAGVEEVGDHLKDQGHDRIPIVGTEQRRTGPSVWALVAIALQAPLLVGCAAAVFVPFVAFQILGFQQFCRPPDSFKPLWPFSWASSTLAAALPSIEPTGLLADPEPRPWCTSGIPYIYGFVQKHYWNVGFLRYFQLRQLPNFALAAPSLGVAVAGAVAFLLRKPALFLSLGTQGSVRPDRTRPGTGTPQAYRSKSRGAQISAAREAAAGQVQKVEDSGEHGQCRTGGGTEGEDELFTAATLPFFLEMLFMACTAGLVMHAQVSTRFLASCPALYWYSAHMIQKGVRARGGYAPLIAGVLIGYSLFYWTAGSLIFVNFYPFT